MGASLIELPLQVGSDHPGGIEHVAVGRVFQCGFLGFKERF